MQVREQDIEEAHRRQVEQRGQSQRQGQASKLASIHAARVRTVRQLAHARRAAAFADPAGGSPLLLTGGAAKQQAAADIIGRYTDWASPGDLYKGW